MGNAVLRNTTSEGSSKKWEHLTSMIQEAARLEARRMGTCFRLDTLVRNLTCRVSLIYLFNLDGACMDAKAVERVATAINKLWIASKRKDLVCEDQLDAAHVKMKSMLLEDLHSIIHHNKADSQKNPLNLLLPAYETMWRVVKMGFLELYWRGEGVHGKNVLQWRTLILNHSTQLTDFDDGDEGGQLCAKDVVKEILRLYPPARRVFRRLSGDSEDSIADIGVCHRNFLLTGEDPDAFRPERWIKIRQDAVAKGMKLKEYELKELGFMPFATMCPAGAGTTSGFGFKMISFLIGGLLQAAKTGEFRMDEEPLPVSVSLPACRIRGDGLLVFAKSVSVGHTDVDKA